MRLLLLACLKLYWTLTLFKFSALRGLEEHKKLEAALDDMKVELKMSNASKENYNTLKEENELILK